MNTDLAALAALVRDERRRRKLKQQELADAAGVSLGVISNLERGLTRPQPANERAILAALELEPINDLDVPAGEVREWPEDVAIALDVAGAVLSAIPNGERRQAIYETTRFLMDLAARSKG